MKSQHRVALVSLLILVCARASDGQQVRPTAKSHATADAIRVDGILDEPAWASAQPIGPLVQSEPTEDAVASFATDVRVLFDATHIYFGVLCRDPSPSAIVTTQLARDADLDVDDRIVIVLDTFFDKRNGFFFAVNPAGARTDGQISNNAEDLNREWDGIWDARAQITPEGWVAEIRIPFNTLRFEPDQTVWGLNVERQIKRLEEIDRWASPQPDLWVANLAAAGELTGLASVRQGLGLDVRPFIGTAREDGDLTFRAGVDVVKSLTSNLTASVTVNTDFAETEVDARQINLTRFDLFFPEKRTFFLEGAGVFDVAGLGGGDLIPFFSRTIGLVDDQEVPILAGAKVSGRQSGFNIGLLDVQTRDTTLEEGPLAGRNHFAGRVSRNLFEQSWVGAIATRGNPSGEGANSLLGLDARFATSHVMEDKNLSVDLFFLRTDDSAGEVAAVDHAYGFAVDYPNDELNARLSFKHIGDAFRPALGFAPRVGIRKADLSLGFEPRPQRFGIRQLTFELRSEIITDLEGGVENWSAGVVPLGVRTDSGEELEWRVTPTFERLNEPFEIADGVVVPPGDYRWTAHRLEGKTASKRRWVIDAEFEVAHFYGGTLRQFAAGVVLKPSIHLGLVAQVERGAVALPQGRFVTEVVAAGVDYAGSPNVTWSNLVQYDSESRLLGVQSRFRWILRPGNDLFLVVNRGWSRGLDDRYVPSFDRGSVKLHYTIRR